MRLHIGAARCQFVTPHFEALSAADWVHLGEPETLEEAAVPSGCESDDSQPIQGTYLSFYYKRGQVLPFPDGRFDFVFSEHFFEHLFLDEACELLKECRRVMRPRACLRIAVPDADLRTYLPPEPVGYTTGDDRWCHPDKHKTRWSIYSLGYVLEQLGFAVRGLVYCDKFGQYHAAPPDLSLPFYRDCLDGDIVGRTDYILRYSKSLVVDAVK